MKDDAIGVGRTYQLFLISHAAAIQQSGDHATNNPQEEHIEESPGRWTGPGCTHACRLHTPLSLLRGIPASYPQALMPLHTEQGENPDRQPSQQGSHVRCFQTLQCILRSADCWQESENGSRPQAVAAGYPLACMAVGLWQRLHSGLICVGFPLLSVTIADGLHAGLSLGSL